MKTKAFKIKKNKSEKHVFKCFICGGGSVIRERIVKDRLIHMEKYEKEPIWALFDTQIRSGQVKYRCSKCGREIPVKDLKGLFRYIENGGKEDGVK